MRRDLNQLASEEYDLLIIGGGVNGLATAWDASLRGLKTALIDKGDFGGATSSASLKIIHGGLRYLQHLDFVRMREHVAERRALQFIAPHLIEPFPFLVPTHGLGTGGRPAMRAAMAVNDIVSYDRNRGLAHDRHIPRGRTISPAEVLEIAPGLDPEGLTGGALFYDARMHNAERMNLLFAIGADHRGADLANYIEATAFRRNDTKLEAVACRDLLDGGSFEIRARSFINMTGPWTDQLVQLARGESDQRALPEQRYSAGFQIISPSVTTREIGLGVTSRHVDPDAKIKRDGGRHYFTTPWRGKTIWGTTDHLYQGAPEQWRIDEDHIVTFIDEINAAMPGAKLDRHDVVHAYGGLRPMEEKHAMRGSQVSRHFQLFDHAVDLGLQNFVSLRGVKYTACRLMAEKTLDLLLKNLDRKARPCMTAETHLPGGEAVPQMPASLAISVAEHLGRTYGSDAAPILERMTENESTRAVLPDSLVTRAELLHALDDESCLFLSDLVFRRTELCTLGHPGPALNEAAEMMAEARSWNDTYKAAEIAAVETRLPVAL